VTSAVMSPKLGKIGLGYVRYEYVVEGTASWLETGFDATVGINGWKILIFNRRPCVLHH
jgi:hypothetical protein